MLMERLELLRKRFSPAGLTADEEERFVTLTALLTNGGALPSHDDYERMRRALEEDDIPTTPDLQELKE